MAFFNEFKEKFNKAAQSVTSKTRESIKDLGDASRLASEARSISNEISALYEKIGRIYVESKGTDHVSLAPLSQQVLELKEKLEEIERQKLQIKNQNRCPACGAGMPKNARFCSNCGQRMPEEAPQAQSAPAAAADDNYCPVCGAMHLEDEAFCPICGFGGPEAGKPEKEEPQIITRPIVIHSEDSSDEAPTDFEAE